MSRPEAAQDRERVWALDLHTPQASVLLSTPCPIILSILRNLPLNLWFPLDEVEVVVGSGRQPYKAHALGQGSEQCQEVRLGVHLWDEQTVGTPSQLLPGSKVDPFTVTETRACQLYWSLFQAGCLFS